MSLLANDIPASFVNTPLASYDSSKWNIPTLWNYRGDLTPPRLTPIIPQSFRPVETSAAIPGICPRSVQWSSTLDWKFTFDNAAAAATRRVNLFTVDRTGVNQPTFIGFVTLTYPGSTVGHTLQGWTVSYTLYTTGTMAVNGTAFTGTGTLLQTSKISVGSRIIFGTIAPTGFTAQNSSTIATITGEGTGTIADNLGVIGDGVYVIEDLQFFTATRNTTTTNGGLNVVKGLSYRDFVAGAGTTIPAATTVDCIKAVYWLADATSVTNITAIGLAMEAATSRTSQMVYIGDSAATTNITMYKYNVRSPLSNLSAGKDFTTATILVAKTGQNAGLTGNTAIVDNIELATTVAGHEAGNGVASIYFCTVSRWYRIPVTAIYTANAILIQDVGIEVPPGGVNSFAATGALACCKYVATIDVFVIMTSSATAFRSYVTKYRINSTRFDRLFLMDDKQLDQASVVNEGLPIHGTTNSVFQTCGVTTGLLFMAGTGTTAITNIGRILPIGADWAYQLGANGAVVAGMQMLVSPKIATPGAITYGTVKVAAAIFAGGSVNEGAGISTEPFKIYYRVGTTGLDANTTAWTVVPDNGDLSAVAYVAGNYIQFGILARCIGDSCYPPGIYGLTVTWNAFTSIANYAFSVDKSDKTNKYFGFKFLTAFGTVVPPLRIKLTQTGTTNVIVDDNTTATHGSWFKSTDGGVTWVAWTNADLGSSTITFLQYRASCPDNIELTPTLGLL
jgi:hypothetical protein